MSEALDLETIRHRLTRWFGEQIPQASNIEVSELVMPGAGSSNETFFLRVDRVERGKRHSLDLVIRWQPTGFLVFPRDAYDMKQQFLLQQRLADTEVPVPPVCWVEENPGVIGAPFYIMERVEGWIPGDFPPYHVGGKLYEASSVDKVKAWNAVIETMAKVHAVDWRTAGLEFLGVPRGKGFIENQVAFWQRVYDQNDAPMPAVLAKSRDWLLDNNFEPPELTLCWGDARLGNMIFQGFNVAAALDWEMACIGDPISDLAWLAHVDWASSEGKPVGATPRLEGLPGIKDSIDYYQQITGREVTHFNYYDVFAAWRLAIVYTRVEQDEKYLARSGNARGVLTSTHFEKLIRLTGQ